MDISETYIQMCERATEIQNVFTEAFNKSQKPPYEKLGGGCFFTPRFNLGCLDGQGSWECTTKESPDLTQGVVYCTGDFRDFCVEWYCDDFSSLHDPSLVIWLPRQDQLQEMVDKSHHPFGLIGDIHEFIKATPISVTSMEQLWLAFVMKEKFNKIWDTEDWVSD